MAYSIADIVADILLGPNQTVTGLLVVVPMIVAFEWDWRRTAITALLPAVVVATSLFGHDHVPGAVLASRLVAVGVGSALAVYASAELARRQTLLRQSRAAAEAAQRAILPIVPDRLGAYLFSSHYRSSAEEALVGGDFYKVIDSPWGPRVIIGDVEGKGLTAVGMSALVLGCFREWAPRTSSLEELVSILDERVRNYEDRSTFVTAIVGSLSDNLTVELANCGHVLPVLSHDRSITMIRPERTTTPLGLRPRPAIQRLHLHPGDRLLFYTDGLVETRTPQGAWVPWEEVLTGVGSDPIDSVLDNIATQITVRGILRDDLAMLLVEAKLPETDRSTAQDFPSRLDKLPVGRSAHQNRGCPAADGPGSQRLDDLGGDGRQLGF